MKEDVLDVANLILSQCDYAQTKDKRGYDKFDATTVRRILSIETPDDGEIEYLRLKLLRYLNQLRKLGRDFGVPNCKIEEVCEKIREPVAPYSVLCRFQTDDSMWHFSLRELMDTRNKTDKETEV